MTTEHPLGHDSGPASLANTQAPNGDAAAAAEPTGRLGKRWMKPLVILAGIVAVLTVFDGAATWYEVAVLQIAEESNPLLRFIESIVGFTGSMVIRTAAGLALLGAIIYWGFRGRDRTRRLFVLGLFICATAFSLLGFYHGLILSVFNF